MADDDLLLDLLAATLQGLRHPAALGHLRRPASERLAFRELGFAIGLHGLARLEGDIGRAPASFPAAPRLTGLVEALGQFLDVGGAILAFWREPAHQAAHSWAEHRDINDVMLATSLVPEGFLVRSPTSVAQG